MLLYGWKMFSSSSFRMDHFLDFGGITLGLWWCPAFGCTYMKGSGWASTQWQ